MKFGDTATYSSLEGVSLCVSIPMQLCVPSGFDRRTGSEVSMDHIFFQGVLAAITLVGGGAGDGVVRASAWCEPGFSSAQGPSLPCSNQGQNQGPRCWSRSSGSWVLSGFLACKGVLAQQGHSLPQWRAEAERAPAVTWCGLGYMLGLSHQACQSPRQSPAHCLLMLPGNRCHGPIQKHYHV